MPGPQTMTHPAGIDVSKMRFPMERDWSALPKAEQTRLGLMAATAAEIYEKGYRAASLADILKRAHATKGALYHHFKDKRALALAAMDHFLHTDLDELWLDPFRQTDDPLTTLRELISFMHTSGAMDDGLKHGCPMVNLTEEMSAKDDGFRELLDGIAREWRGAMEAALRRGQKVGKVRKDIDPEGIAMLFFAVRHGVLSLAKTTKDNEMLAKCAGAFFDYLESLRPPGSTIANE